MKKNLLVVLTLVAALTGGVLFGCSSNSASTDTAKSDTAKTEQTAAEETAAMEETAANGAATTGMATYPAADVEMKYASVDEAKGYVGNDAYLFVDCRKAADFEAGHIDGAVSADMDPIVHKDDKAAAEDPETAMANMKTAMQKATKTDNGGDKKIILVCYSGKRYAQAATNCLSALGANMDNVTTLEGGMKAWEA